MGIKSIKIFSGIASIAGLFVFAVVAQPVRAEGPTVVVTPDNTQGWTSTLPVADTRANGSVSFVNDSNAPLGTGALRLATTSNIPSGQDKAQYMIAKPIALVQVQSINYWTKQLTASFPDGTASFQLPVCLTGINKLTNGCNPKSVSDTTDPTKTSFTTLVYEPYVSKGSGAVHNNVWQEWNAGEGVWWSTRAVGTLLPSQGTYTYTLVDILKQFPNAEVTSFGVNVGSNNPNYTILVDSVKFNGITYDFEVKPYSASTKDQCKNDGWMNFQTTYKNQGQCVASVQSNSNSKLNQ